MIALIHLWLASYGRCALILGLALLIGYPAGRRYLRGAAALPLAIMLGLALLGLLVCLLGWVHWFTRSSMIVTAVVALAATVVCLRRDIPRWRAAGLTHLQPRVPVVAGFAILGAALVFFSFLALYPVNGFDATSYHLPLARDLVRHHGLGFDPFVRYSFFPQTGESLFAVMLMLSGNPIRCSALEFSALAVTVLMIPAWFLTARRTMGAGFIAAIVVLASPDVIFCGTTAYVDTLTMGFVLAALLVGLDATRDPVRRRSSLALMGVFVGAAASTKYTGLLFGGLAGVGVLIAVRRSPMAIWRDFAVALAAFCVVAVPWYAWTVHTAGDPLYPFAAGLFGSKHLWTPSEIAFQISDARASPPGFSSILHQTLRYLAGELPYDTGVNRSPLSWLLGLGVLGLALPSARRDRAFLGALVSGVLCIAATLQLSADPRYTVPAVGVLAVAAGMAAEHIWHAVYASATTSASGLRPVRGWRVIVVPAALAATAIVGLWTSVAFARDNVYNGGEPPISGNAVNGYVASRLPCYTAVKWLNANAGPHYRAWGYVCEEARYYATDLLISDTFGLGSRMRIFDNDGATLPSADVLWRRLAPLRVGWMILPAGDPPNPHILEVDHRFRVAASLGAEVIYQVEPR